MSNMLIFRANRRFVRSKTARLRQIDLDVPGFLLRSGLVEAGAGEKDRFGRAIARAAGRGGRRSHSRGSRRSLFGAWRRRVADLLVQASQHAGGFPAARHAEIQPLLLSEE